MKKTIHLLLFIVLLLSAPKAMAQVVSICAGQDSVRLRLENYQYGKIQWMSSYDNENWELIEDATDTVYEFMPEENKYYRAQVFFNDCEPVFSATSYVQTLPKPFAGTDKTLSTGSGIYLSASTQPGSIGQWDILSGVGGVLANDTSAYSFFYGSDTTYLLRWTMTNACGSRSDTLKIRYVETVYYPDIVYVDSTDQVLSDSAEMVNGHYRIIFSDSSVVVTDSSVLIGSLTKAFFEKVEHVQMVGDTCIMKTHPATFDDILVYGVLNVSEVHYIDTVRHAPMPYILLDHLPTRAEMQIPEIRNGHYWIVEEGELRDGDGLFDNMTVYDHNFHISYSFITASGGRYMRITPNFQCEYWKSGGRHLKFGCENATLKIGEWGDVTIGGTYTIPLGKCNIPHTLAGIPMKACIKPYISITGQCHFTYDHHSTYKFNALLIYHQNSENEYIRNFYEDSRTSSFEFSGDVEVKLGLTFHEDVAGGFFIFDTLGPYVDVALCASFAMCQASPYTAPKAFKLYPKIKVGAKASLRWKIPKLFKGVDLYYEYSFHPLIRWQNPYRMIPMYGDYQVFSGDNWLLNPIGVKVLTLWETPSVSTIVHFVPDPGCGEVENEWVETDENGIAQTRWKPSISGNDVQRLGIQVLGCSSHISGSPIRFQARKGQCLMDDFRLTTYSSGVGDNFKICSQLENTSPSFGPYYFSLDGTHYSSNPTCVTNPAYDEPIVFYAKNGMGCVVTCTDMLKSPDCDQSDLTLNNIVEDYTVKVIPSGGQAPYSYCLDNASIGFITYQPFNGSHTYTDLTPGEHLFEVRDSKGCVKGKTITIGMPITVSFNPNCMSYTGVMPNQYVYHNIATSLNPNTYVRDGYTFIGWNTKSDGSGTQYEDMGTVTLTQDITLYAQWGNDVNRIVFHSNGGVGTMNPFLAQHGTTITLPHAIYTHPCLDFREWNTMMDGTGVTYQNMGTLVLNSDMDLYAQWDSVVVGVVSFYPNGAAQCDVHQQMYYKCSPKELDPCRCDYYAHVFTGWNTASNGGGTPYNDRDIIEPDGDMSLYAQWRPANVYTISFDVNGGEGNIDDITGYETETIQLPEATPTKNGYLFVCWNTASDGSGVSYNPNSQIVLNQNITLFAQWEQFYYTVTFNANGGEGIMEPQRFYPDSLTRLNPNTFTRLGVYMFSHWNTDELGTGVSYDDQEEIIIDHNLTLFAQWTSHPERTSCVVNSYHDNETVENGRLKSVRDHEGNIYPVVQMNNNSCWIRTNMRVTTSPTTGASLTVLPGNLYDWYNATDNGTVRGICPYGWHVPTGSEWQSDILSVGSPVYISGSGWEESSVLGSPGDYSDESRNYSNFTILPVGKYFINDGTITGIGNEAWFWFGGSVVNYMAPFVRYSYQNAYPTYGQAVASCYYLSVRCVRD